MPKHEIDYSNTIIYKITCNDLNVSDLFLKYLQAIHLYAIYRQKRLV